MVSCVRARGEAWKPSHVRQMKVLMRPKSEPELLEACRYKNPGRSQMSEDTPGLIEALWTLRGEGPDMEGGEDLFQSREKGHSVS